MTRGIAVLLANLQAMHSVVNLRHSRYNPVLRWLLDGSRNL